MQIYIYTCITRVIFINLKLYLRVIRKNFQIIPWNINNRT